MSDLKPCPFCGQTPELKEWQWPRSVAYRVHCVNELCCRPCVGDYNSPEIAVERWNTRLDDRRKAELLQDVRRMEYKVEELEKHLDEKDAIINRLVIALSENKQHD